MACSAGLCCSLDEAAAVNGDVRGARDAAGMQHLFACVTIPGAAPLRLLCGVVLCVNPHSGWANTPLLSTMPTGLAVSRGRARCATAWCSPLTVCYAVLCSMQDEDIFRAVMDDGKPNFDCYVWDRISPPAKV